MARLASFAFPDELAGRYPEFDVAARQAVLGGNAARLYRVPLPAADRTLVPRRGLGRASDRTLVPKCGNGQGGQPPGSGRKPSMAARQA